MSDHIRCPSCGFEWEQMVSSDSATCMKCKASLRRLRPVPTWIEDGAAPASSERFVFSACQPCRESVDGTQCQASDGSVATWADFGQRTSIPPLYDGCQCVLRPAES